MPPDAMPVAWCLASRDEIPYERMVCIATRAARADAERTPGERKLMVQEEDESSAPAAEEAESRPGGIPLYVWVLGAVALAIPVGLFWAEGATRLDLLPKLIIRAIGAGGSLGGACHPQLDRGQRYPRPPGGPDDVIASTFSTASTAATIPITFRALTGKRGVSRESSQLATCVGTNFNNDGTALYQASAVLFLAQASGIELGWVDQLIVVLTTLVASVAQGASPRGVSSPCRSSSRPSGSRPTRSPYCSRSTGSSTVAERRPTSSAT